MQFNNYLKSSIINLNLQEIEGKIEGIVATTQVDFAREQFEPYAFSEQIAMGYDTIPIDIEHNYIAIGSGKIFYNDTGDTLYFKGEISKDALPAIIALKAKVQANNKELYVSGHFDMHKRDAVIIQKNGIEITKYKKATIKVITITENPVQPNSIITSLKSIEKNDVKKMLSNIAKEGNLKDMTKLISQNFKITKTAADALVWNVVKAHQNYKLKKLDNNKIVDGSSQDIVGSTPTTPSSIGGELTKEQLISDITSFVKDTLVK